jgi:hypothetical protein
MPVIRCPTCNARYKVSVEAGGKQAKCAKCGQGFRIPVLQPPADEPHLTSLDALAGGAEIELESRPPAAQFAPSAEPLAEAVPVSEGLGYAPGEPGAEAASSPEAYAAYFRSLGHALTFPTRFGDLITFGIVWLILVVGMFIGYGGVFGVVGSLIVTAWYMAFQLNVVLGAAGGEEDLPTLSLTEGWWDGVCAPFCKMLATQIVIYLPALVFLMSTGALKALTGRVGGIWGLLQALDTKTAVVAGVLLAAGHFLWPIVVLVVAVGSIAGFVRVDLIVRTIARSLPAYLLTVLAVYVSIGLTAGATLLVQAASARNVPGLPPVFVLVPLLKIVELYFTVIAMRAIGFYYHHFKHRFAWSWG